MKLDIAWEIGDTLNGLMAVPNMVGVLLLSGIVGKLTRSHFNSADKSNKSPGLRK
jgi:AGCS family alanine or glycine:cation symporter